LILGGDLAALQAPMFDGDTFNVGALGEHGFVFAEVGVGTVLRLWPSSRPLPYGFPAPCPGRSRRNHAKSEHQAFSLVKEDSHIVSLLPFRRSLACSTEIPVLFTAPHPLMAPVRFTGFTASYGSLSANFAC
jgi:hypothetical protein